MTAPREPDAPFVTFDLDTSDREILHLAGHTIEELSDYLDAGCTPADPTIDASPECQIALRSLERLRTAQASLLSQDVARAADRDDSWVASILQNINVEAHAGRDIPFTHPASTARLIVTEGAVRGILRAAGDSLANIVVGRCRLDGDVSVPGDPITIRIDAAVGEGEDIPVSAAVLREAVYTALRTHTQLNVVAIEITIRDIYLRQPVGESTPSTTSESTPSTTSPSTTSPSTELPSAESPTKSSSDD